MTGRAAFWAVFAALVGLYAHGVRESGLFAQQVWSATGLARAAWFVGLYAAGSGSLLLAARRWWALALALASVAYAVAACGVAAVAAVTLLLVSSWALGGRVAPGLTGVVLGLNVWAWLVGAAVHLPIHTGGAYGAALLLPLAFEWRRLREGARAAAAWLRAGCQLSRAEAAAAAALGLPLAMHLAVAAGPETGADALAMHLAIPASVEAHQRWVFEARHTAWAVMPMQANWCFTAAYLLGGEAAARLMNFAGLALTAGLLYGLARRILARAGALWLAALFASSPVLQLVTGSLFAENFWSLTLLGAFASLVRYQESGEARWALAAAALAGGGLATKYGSLAFVAPAAVALGLELRRRGARRLAPALLVLFVVFGLPPYARAYFETGNPVFPFFNHVFGSPYFDSGQPFADARFARPLSAATFYDATFHTSRHLEGQNGGWGFQYLFLVPLALVCRRRGEAYAGRAALAIGLGFAVLTMAGQSNVRYLCPALPLLTLAAGGVLKRRAGLAASVALFGLNLWFLPASGWQHKDFAPGILDAPARERFLAAAAPVRNLVAWLNRECAGQPVAFLESNQIAGLRGAAFTGTWHNHAFAAELAALKSPEQAWDLLARRELRLLIAPANLEGVTHAHLRRLLFAQGATRYESGGWRVWRLRESAGAFPLPEETVPPGVFDDMDPRVVYLGAWHGGRQFSQAANASVTYTDQAGARFRLRFRGRGVTWVYTKADNRGRATARLNGREWTVELHSRDTAWQARTAFDASGGGPHVFEVEAAGGGYVDLDALIVRE